MGGYWDNEALLGYPLTLFSWRLPEVRVALAARGARLEETASFPETLRENRPELHWHRFPKAGHLFVPHALAAGPFYSAARLFRILWPSRAVE